MRSARGLSRPGSMLPSHWDNRWCWRLRQVMDLLRRRPGVAETVVRPALRMLDGCRPSIAPTGSSLRPAVRRCGPLCPRASTASNTAGFFCWRPVKRFGGVKVLVFCPPAPVDHRQSSRWVPHLVGWTSPTQTTPLRKIPVRSGLGIRGGLAADGVDPARPAAIRPDDGWLCRSPRRFAPGS